jgi:hypothetical protein
VVDAVDLTLAAVSVLGSARQVSVVLGSVDHALLWAICVVRAVIGQVHAAKVILLVATAMLRAAKKARAMPAHVMENDVARRKGNVVSRLPKVAEVREDRKADRKVVLADAAPGLVAPADSVVSAAAFRDFPALDPAVPVRTVVAIGLIDPAMAKEVVAIVPMHRAMVSATRTKRSSDS